MRSIATVIERCFFVCMSGKTAEPIKMPFGRGLWGPKDPRIRSKPGRPDPHGKGRCFEGRTLACPDSPAVDILNVVRKEAAAMRLLAVSTAATCR